MHRTITLACLIFISCMALGATAVAAGKTPATKAPNADTAASPIAYDDLREHIGERIVVQTRFRTTRTGTLSKFSKMELTLTIDTASGPSEITIPKDNVVRATPADKPAAKH